MSFGAVSLRHMPIVIGVNSNVLLNEKAIGGFLCTATGTLTIDRIRPDGTVANLFTALPVTAGQWTFMPFHLGDFGASVTTAVGASGVIAA